MTRKIICTLLALLLCTALAAGVSAADNTAFLYDEANLLTDAEAAVLAQKLETVSRSYNAQLVVATIDSMNGGDVDTFVDYLYDTMGFGYGETHDGVLLLVCMNPREYRILSNGYAGVAIDPGSIDMICDVIVASLSNGEYADAFTIFADECAYYLDGYLNGFPFNAIKNLGISLVIGLAVGLLVVFILKSQLKSVRSQNSAGAYVKSGSMAVTVRNDIYLYRNVTRTKKQTSSSSGSGGSSRSKGGGSF